MKTSRNDRRTRKHGGTARRLALATFAMLLAAAPLQAARAQTAPSLGTAASYGVLANSAVTCTDSTINGDVGIFTAGTPVTQTNCTINGSIHAGDASAAAAYADFVAAWDELAAMPSEECDAWLSGTLADVVLPPGTYCFEAAATLAGQLTLDGPAGAIWIFKVGTAGTGALTGTNFSVVMIGGAQACDVYWWVAEAVTMTTSNFQGTILAGAATTFTGGSLIGRDLTKAAATLTGVIASACTPGTPPVVCKDRVTGGGWIILPDGGKGTFAVSGGIRDGQPRGHLTFVDHGSKSAKTPDMKVKGTGVTSYTTLSATTRRIDGTAEIDGESGYTYRVDVTDAGEPGRDDVFTMELSNGYSASGFLAGGNIQLHERCRPAMCEPYDHDRDRDRDRDHDGDRDHDRDGKKSDRKSSRK